MYCIVGASCNFAACCNACHEICSCLVKPPIFLFPLVVSAARRRAAALQYLLLDRQ